MALPTRGQVLTLDYALDGGPSAPVAAKSGIILDTLDYALDGAPFWGFFESNEVVDAQIFWAIGAS